MGQNFEILCKDGFLQFFSSKNFCFNKERVVKDDLEYFDNFYNIIKLSENNNIKYIIYFGAEKLSKASTRGLIQ